MGFEGVPLAWLQQVRTRLLAVVYCLPLPLRSPRTRQRRHPPRVGSKSPSDQLHPLRPDKCPRRVLTYVTIGAGYQLANLRSAIEYFQP